MTDLTEYKNLKNYIMEMFKATSSSGLLAVPDAFDESKKLVCKMKWKEQDAERMVRELFFILSTFAELSDTYDDLIEMDDESLFFTLSDEQLRVWNLFRPLFMHELYHEKADQVKNKQNLIFEAKELKKRSETGEKLNMSELQMIEEYGNKTIPESDEKFLSYYETFFENEAEMRIGTSSFACMTVVIGGRLWQSMAQNMPEHVIERETKEFINCYVFHHFSKKFCLKNIA